jgi:hypothetical protein
MSPAPLFDRHLLRRAFDLLAAKLADRDVVGEVHVFGGAAMVLAYHARAATRDVDALLSPDEPVLDAAAEVARELDLPRSWLNNQASTYVSGRAGRGTPVYDHPNLRVMTTPPEHLLAIKARAARAARDTDDLRLLLGRLDLRTLDDVTALVSTFFPGEPLSERSRLLLEDLLAERG